MEIKSFFYWLLVFDYSCLNLQLCAEKTFDDFDLEFVKTMHRSYCLLKPFCSPPAIQTIPPPVLFENGTIFLPELPEAMSFLPNPFPPLMNDGTCCKDCSCDLDLCPMSGTCCPDLLDHLPTVDESVSKTKRECQMASLKKPQGKVGIKVYEPPGLLVWMITKCSDKFDGDQDIKDKCEMPDYFTEWDTIIPVADNGTITAYYQNIYCAICHNVSVDKLVNFEASIACAYDELLPSSMETLIDEVKNRYDCNIVFNSPLNGSVQTCEPVIKECNVTGLWQDYNPVTEAACHAYMAIYHGRYNNIFCFLCNEWPYTLPEHCYYSDGGTGLPAFSALLKFTEPSKQIDHAERSISKCEKTQMFDEWNNLCRDLFCFPPKSLSDGKCVDTVEYVTGVSYEAFLKLTPNKTISTNNVVQTASEVWKIYEAFFSVLGVGDLIYERSMYYESAAFNNSLVNFFVLYFKLYFKNFSRQSNVFLSTLLSLNDEERIFTTNDSTIFSMSLAYYEERDKILQLQSRDNIPKPMTAIDGVPPAMNRTFSERILNLKPKLVTKLLGCAAVKLDLNDSDSKHLAYPVTRYPAGSYMVVNESGITYVYVCVDDFIHSVRGEENQQHITETGNTGLPQGILSLICTCISLLCLILTLFTYCLFPDLRTQPGINNVALVICLIVAQAMFQFGSNQSDNIHEWGCQVIGIFIHFFWLMVIFWMNVCCIHMFSVFIAFKKISTRKSTVKQTIIYSAYTMLASAALVITNIVVSWADSSRNDMGYGGNMCYISDYRMVGYVFALPIGIIIISNLVCFMAVVVKMCRVPTVDSETQHNRNLFAIYAKLSTLTGATWVWGFVYFFTGVAALEYIFIIFNASQGIFIFLAFSCNSRVIGLYKSRITGTKLNVSGHFNTTKTKTTNLIKYTTPHSASDSK